MCTNHTNETANNIRVYQATAGTVLSPFDCWLLNRSLATFFMRLAAECKNAVTIAAFLKQHNNIEKVFYPGLETHSNHKIAKQQ